jgi:hypothetical protein
LDRAEHKRGEKTKMTEETKSGLSEATKKRHKKAFDILNEELHTILTTKPKEINKDKAICEKCGNVMNIPKSYANLCYDCEEQIK